MGADSGEAPKKGAYVVRCVGECALSLVSAARKLMEEGLESG